MLARHWVATAPEQALTMRLIAGKYRSRRLQSLPGMDTRPTSDRLRETLFDVLCARNPAALEGSVWFDLYAGTGAVGIEALSRGAAQIYFVEAAAKTSQLIEKNLKSLSVSSGVEVMHLDVHHALRKLDSGNVAGDFFFLDPPYRLQNEYALTLRALAQSRILKDGALVIAEHERKFDPGVEFDALQRYRLLQQGDAALSFYRKS